MVQGDESTDGRGEVRLWPGTPDTLEQLSRVPGPAIMVQGRRGLPGDAEPGDAFGRAIAAGDVDGDGHGDVVAAAPGDEDGSGSLTVIRGARDGFAGSGHHQAEPDPGWGDRFGSALFLLDLDDGGRLDLVVGIGGAASVAGAVVVYAGGKDGFVKAERLAGLAEHRAITGPSPLVIGQWVFSADIVAQR